VSMRPFKSCMTNFTPNVSAPDPSRWELIASQVYLGGYVLTVRYPDATNYEGIKVMVYRGRYPGNRAILKRKLDPHFTRRKNSPIARFRPDDDGVEMARDLARSLTHWKDPRP